jgi:hypothetical protein
VAAVVAAAVAAAAAVAVAALEAASRLVAMVPFVDVAGKLIAAAKMSQQKRPASLPAFVIPISR